MAEFVFVLGAGASADCGAPLMFNFLDRAEDLWLGGEAGDDATHFERVFRSIAALKNVHAQLSLDTYNLEALFSAFEMGAMIGRLGSITDQDEIDATRSAMVRLIARTLQVTVKFPVANGRQVTPPGSYGRLVDLLRRINEQRVRTRRPRARNASSIITLNYDMGLDYALHYASMPATYAISEATGSAEAVPLLKLHGSLNWSACVKCGVVVPWDLGDYFRKYDWHHLPMLDDPRSVPFGIADHLNDLQHCDTSLTGGPALVPPTWNKSDNRQLRNVWRRAAQELSEARYIVFAGYSFPESDLYFRYLLALGLAGETRIRKIIVLNPDSAALDRLKKHLSPTLQDRVHFEPKPFRQGITLLDDLLEVKQTPS